MAYRKRTYAKRKRPMYKKKAYYKPSQSFAKKVQSVIHKELEKKFVELSYTGTYALDKHAYTVGSSTYNYPLTVNFWNLIRSISQGTSQNQRTGSKIFIQSITVRVTIRLSDNYQSPYNTAATQYLKDPRLRCSVWIPRQCAQGDPAVLTEPFINRTKINNPYEIGFPNTTGDSIPYMFDFKTFRIMADQMYNTTVGGCLPQWSFSKSFYVRQHYDYDDNNLAFVNDEALWRKIPFISIMPGQIKNGTNMPYTYHIDYKIIYTDA